MCGIAGFSLTPTSKVKPKQLSNALLTAIEDRGYMASGFAFQVGTDMGYFKAPMPGSTLPLKRMPKDARHVILHTRLATHGSVNDNRNNHPVMSPNEDIALVHNGVIYNHEQVRLKIDADLPDVDTSVIPAVIEQLGVNSLDVLDGDAAIAWFNRREPDTLHLARYQHSPLTVCQIEDGSFIFASTEALLWKVLIQLDLMPTWMHQPRELDYFTVRDGVVLSSDRLPAPQNIGGRYDYGYYRHQTSGAKPGISSATPKYLPGYGWEDWDDWEDYNGYAYADYSPKDVMELEDAIYQQPADAALYTMTMEDDRPAVITYYTNNEVDMWKNELYLIAATPNCQLVDYGAVRVDGTLASSMESELF